jgi:hypothetical protein
MDDLVKQALVKWPNVPHCYGWLGLDGRGNWYLRDDAAQARGSFSSGKKGAKGSILRHDKLIDFIQRNYAADAEGCWFFQNGPQRVYVELEVSPWVWRLSHAGADIKSHSGESAQYIRCLMDEDGWLYLETTLGFGLVHTLDMLEAAKAIEDGAWTVENIQRSTMANLYGYAKSPSQEHNT